MRKKNSFRVYYDDTDAGGVVYHGSYVRFFDRSRAEWFYCHGFSQRVLATENVVFAVRHLEIDYKSPAYLDDTLDVITKLVTAGYTSISFEQILSREEKIIAVATVRVVCIDILNFRPMKIPKKIREKIIE